MTFKNFEDFLNYKFAETHPQVLDDEMPDMSSEWIGELDSEQMIEYADEYAKIHTEQFLKTFAKGSETIGENIK